MAQEKDDATLIDSAFDSTLFTEQFLDKMKRIEAQRAQLELYTANLDLLVRRFNVEQSVFGKVASGFSSLTWWQKGLIGLVLGGALALVGLAFSVAWVIALPLIFIAVYAGVVYLFEDYAQSDKNRFAQLSEGVVNREAEMKASVLELQTTTNEIGDLLVKLKDFGDNYSEVVDKFNELAYLLTEQVQRHQDAVLQFEELKASYSAHVQSMQTEEGAFSEDLTQVSRLLYQQFERIKKTTGEVERATQQLSESVASLKEESLTITVEKTQKVSGRFDELLEGFHYRTEEDQQKDEARFVHADAFLRQTDEFISDFDNFLKQQNALNQSYVAVQKPETTNRAEFH